MYRRSHPKYDAGIVAGLFLVICLRGEVILSISHLLLILEYVEKSPLVAEYSQTRQVHFFKTHSGRCAVTGQIATLLGVVFMPNIWIDLIG